jgi:hypothetical protein
LFIGFFERLGAADCGEYRQAAGAFAKDLKRVPSYNVLVVVSGDGEHRDATPSIYLGIFVAAAFALVVCGCILTRKPRKKLPMN